MANIISTTRNYNLNLLSDSISWSLNSKCIFSTKSVYEWLKKDLSGSHHNGYGKLASLWKSKIFSWQRFQNGVVTCDNMLVAIYWGMFCTRDRIPSRTCGMLPLEVVYCVLLHVVLGSTTESWRLCSVPSCCAKGSSGGNVSSWSFCEPRKINDPWCFRCSEWMKPSAPLS